MARCVVGASVAEVPREPAGAAEGGGDPLKLDRQVFEGRTLPGNLL